jgi:alpha-L-fucosidase
MKMFTLTTKHHEGFSLFDTKTRVKSRANWTAAGGPSVERSNLAQSVMETPFRRDIVKEICLTRFFRTVLRTSPSISALGDKA